MLGTFLTAIDWFGTAVFAVTGAHVASRKRMDISGFILLGCATGMGGGTLRDAMLGALPVFWVREPVYLAVCVGVSAATFFLAHIPESRYRVLLWLDAAGLALFCVVGVDRARRRSRAVHRGGDGRRERDLRRRDPRYSGRRKPAHPARGKFTSPPRSPARRPSSGCWRSAR